MTPDEKGKRYAQIFRKAGALLAKGNIARAVEVLKEGQALAHAAGDLRMAQRFADQIALAEKPEK
jgi:predicted ATPase